MTLFPSKYGNFCIVFQKKIWSPQCENSPKKETISTLNAIWIILRFSSFCKVMLLGVLSPKMPTCFHNNLKSQSFQSILQKLISLEELKLMECKLYMTIDTLFVWTLHVKFTFHQFYHCLLTMFALKQLKSPYQPNIL